jgi:hypothetical protein
LQKVQTAILRAFDDGPCQRVLAALLHGGGELQHVVFGKIAVGGQLRQSGPALGERARLVDDDRVDLLHDLEHLCALDEHAVFGAAADAHHDRHRRGQPERARASHDQDGHRVDQGVDKTRLGP